METKDLKVQVRKAARGDERAAGALFDEYFPRVYRFALGRVRDTHDAEDVAAETFAKALRHLDRFRWRGSGFEAWLFRIAANVVVDRYREGAREQPVEHVDDNPPSDDATPEDLVLRSESAIEVNDMVHELPDDQRDVLLLRFAGGLSAEEAGEVLGRNANAVRQLQFRALAQLRKRMEP